MILNVYAYFNKYLEAFGQYNLDDHGPENVAFYLQRDIKAMYLRGESLTKYKELNLYVLGTFDDQTGEFKNDKHLVLDLSVVVAQLEALKAEKKEEKKEGN